VTGTRFRRVAEGDGVLQMLLWLDRTPESFVPGHQAAGGATEALVKPSAQGVLRFDTRRLHAALDAQRTERELTWAQVAREVGLAASSLTHLSKGGRTGFPDVMRMVKWLGRPASSFTRVCDS